MKNNELQKSDHAGQIDTAMALIRHGKNVTRSAAPEMFDLFCICAVHDKPYTLRFVRQGSGLLRFSASIKGSRSSSPDNARAADIGWTLRLDLFENGSTPCAWCFDDSFNHCAGYCGALVCGGRMKGNTFHCRPSCGAVWAGVPLAEVKGTAQNEVRRPSRPAGLTVARPVKEMLLLPAGAPSAKGR